jgi:hypothetical protein
MAAHAFQNQSGVIFVNPPRPQPFVLVPYNPPVLTPLGFSLLTQMDEERSLSLLQVLSFYLGFLQFSLSFFFFLYLNFDFFDGFLL